MLHDNGVSWLQRIGYIATKLAQRAIDRNVQIDELVSYGWMGLRNAARAWKPGKAPWEYYARRRIYGAMLDGLRTENWYPRSKIRTHKLYYLEDMGEL